MDKAHGGRFVVVSLLALTLIVGGANLLATYLQVKPIRAISTAAAVAARQAETASASQLALCQAGNTARAEQIGLWEYILHLSGPAPSARERAVQAAFVHHLHVVFAPRNCAAIQNPKGT